MSSPKIRNLTLTASTLFPTRFYFNRFVLHLLQLLSLLLYQIELDIISKQLNYFSLDSGQLNIQYAKEGEKQVKKD